MKVPTNSREVARTASQAASKAKSAYPEIKDIGNDLKSLKSNVGELAQHVKEDSVNGISEFAQMEMQQISDFTTRIENAIRRKPAQSIAIAFAGGLIASLLLGRR